MDVTGRVDPEIAAALASLPRLNLEPGPEMLATIRSARALVYDEPPPEGVRREDRVVPGAPGDPDVAVRIFRPTSPVDGVPGYLWIHGGGYVLGSHEGDKPALDRLVAKLGCVAMSVEYRLAPETSYPGPLEDCYAALAFLHGHAAELGVDPNRLAVGGASAGGGLAAGLALLARDRSIPLVHQQLIYPMIDDRQVTPSSGWVVPTWTKELNTFGWRSYLGELSGSDEVPAYAAPSRADDLTGLPPTYIHVGTLDGFLHEDIDYAARLLAAGVETELHVYPGAPHGFDSMAGATTIGRQANACAATALAKVLTP
jgi:acetyl esterase/lipase